MLITHDSVISFTHTTAVCTVPLSAHCLVETSNEVQFVCLGGIRVLPTDIAGLPNVWMKYPLKFDFTTRYVSHKHTDILQTQLDSVLCKKINTMSFLVEAKKKNTFCFSPHFRVWQVIINNVFTFVSDQSLSTTIMKPYFYLV